ncbi:MAG: hypothetical protein HQL31_07480, partial [Planctomycetes bacterium]|nr:hypothetical protein [Planctomycetota bacterium]
ALQEVLIELLREELKEAVNWFNFLCDNRMRIELREKDFSKELDRKISDFMEAEEDLQGQSEMIKENFSKCALLSEASKAKRKELLGAFEKEKGKVDQGIEAFYGRVKEYVQADKG